MVAELVREDDVHLAVAEAAVEQRVPEDDPRRRAEPEGVGVGLARVAAHLLDAQRDVVDPLRAVVAVVRCARSSAIVRPLEPVTRYGPEKTSTAAISAKTPAPGIHHQEPSRRASAITTRSAMQTATNVPPSPSQPPKIASRYPTSETPWRRSHQSAASANGSCVSHDDREPEHPEEHPGPDRPGRRLARVADAVAGVHRERREEHDLREEPVDERNRS